jgi:hypothetical protein
LFHKLLQYSLAKLNLNGFDSFIYVNCDSISITQQQEPCLPSQSSQVEDREGDKCRDQHQEDVVRVVGEEKIEVGMRISQVSLD